MSNHFLMNLCSVGLQGLSVFHHSVEDNADEFHVIKDHWVSPDWGTQTPWAETGGAGTWLKAFRGL